MRSRAERAVRVAMGEDTADFVFRAQDRRELRIRRCLGCSRFRRMRMWTRRGDHDRCMPRARPEEPRSCRPVGVIPIAGGRVTEGAPLTVRRESGVVHVSGEVDSATVQFFRDVLRRCDLDPTVRWLDLSAVRFFSAAGVGALVAAGWCEHPPVRVIVSPIVRRVMVLCDLEFVLDRHNWRGAPRDS